MNDILKTLDFWAGNKTVIATAITSLSVMLNLFGFDFDATTATEAVVQSITGVTMVIGGIGTIYGLAMKMLRK